MVVPCLEITCTMSHSHLFVCFPKRYRLFLKRKEGASEVQFCSNSGETAESTCFSFATHSRQLPPGSGQRKRATGERGTQSQLARGWHRELQRNVCISRESLYINQNSHENIDTALVHNYTVVSRMFRHSECT